MEAPTHGLLISLNFFARREVDNVLFHEEPSVF